MRLTASATRFASLFFSGIFAGFVVTVLVIELSLRSFGGSVYTQVRHIELAWLDVLASATLLPAIVATAVLLVSTIRRRRNPGLAGAAFLLMLLIFVTTMAINLPINTDQIAWAVESPPANWASVRDDWQAAHLVRVVASVLAFGCLIATGGRAQPAVSQSCDLR